MPCAWEHLHSRVAGHSHECTHTAGNIWQRALRLRKRPQVVHELCCSPDPTSASSGMQSRAKHRWSMLSTGSVPPAAASCLACLLLVRWATKAGAFRRRACVHRRHLRGGPCSTALPKMRAHRRRHIAQVREMQRTEPQQEELGTPSPPGVTLTCCVTLLSSQSLHTITRGQFWLPSCMMTSPKCMSAGHVQHCTHTYSSKESRSG